VSETVISRWRNLVGVLLKDYGRYRRALRAKDSAYLGICNRSERLEPAPCGRGYRCNWQWTSDLHAPLYLPSLGVELMKRALADHPINHAAAIANLAQAPDVSFVIGHRGKERLPHLLSTIRSIAAQRGASVECILVEQSVTPETKDELPSWVRYIHTTLPYAEMPYSRAWSFNVGARLAVGKVLVLHDNDLLVPSDYAKEIVERFEEGHDVINLKRFIFYLGEVDSASTCSAEALSLDAAPTAIMQNALGGTIAISRDAYLSIGGFDESFVGWGGEDNEFWERAQTRSCWPYGYLPFLHLWHAPQGEKLSSDRSTAKLFEKLSRVPVSERIADLASRDFGNPRSCLVVAHPSSGVGQQACAE
jgi:GT2 family glycosyltransferase